MVQWLPSTHPLLETSLFARCRPWDWSSFAVGLFFLVLALAFARRKVHPCSSGASIIVGQIPFHLPVRALLLYEYHNILCCSFLRRFHVGFYIFCHLTFLLQFHPRLLHQYIIIFLNSAYPFSLFRPNTMCSSPPFGQATHAIMTVWVLKSLYSRILILMMDKMSSREVVLFVCAQHLCLFKNSSSTHLYRQQPPETLRNSCDVINLIVSNHPCFNGGGCSISLDGFIPISSIQLTPFALNMLPRVPAPWFSNVVRLIFS